MESIHPGPFSLVLELIIQVHLIQALISAFVWTLRCNSLLWYVYMDDVLCVLGLLNACGLVVAVHFPGDGDSVATEGFAILLELVIWIPGVEFGSLIAAELAVLIVPVEFDALIVPVEFSAWTVGFDRWIAGTRPAEPVELWDVLDKFARTPRLSPGLAISKLGAFRLALLEFAGLILLRTKLLLGVVVWTGFVRFWADRTLCFEVFGYSSLSILPLLLNKIFVGLFVIAQKAFRKQL